MKKNIPIDETIEEEKDAEKEKEIGMSHVLVVKNEDLAYRQAG